MGKLTSRILGTFAAAFAAMTVAAAITPALAEVDLHPRRLVQWVERGGDPDVVYSVFHRIDRFGDDGPGSWIYEWSTTGAFYADRAAKHETAGEFDAARDDYLSAALYYSIAKFPDNATPEQRAAYKKHLEYYQKAGRYFDPPLQIVKIKFRGEDVVGYLHLPKNKKKPPLILWANGIDTHKADVYTRIKPFLDRGIAILTVDTIGTGENARWRAEPGGEAMLKAFIDKMQKDKRVDGSRIGHVGISFGGYFAARMAATEPRLKAVAPLCAPVDAQFKVDLDWYHHAAQETMAALTQAVHVQRGDFPTLIKTIRSYSLIDEGLIGGDHKIKTPMLVANGDQDPLVPVSDMKALAASGENSDLWILGGSGHCAGGYGPVLYPKIADWFVAHLGAE